MKPPNVETCTIISTPEKRISLLLAKALEYAEDGNVLFMSKTPFNQLPEATFDIGQVDKDVLRRISFVYPSDCIEIAGKCSEIHTWRNMPQAIIIDRLDNYFDLDSKISNKSAFLCATLLDAAGVCARRNKNTCKIIVSVDRDTFKANRKTFSVLFEIYLCDDIIEI